jgi:hypothetical protein
VKKAHFIKDKGKRIKDEKRTGIPSETYPISSSFIP